MAVLNRWNQTVGASRMPLSLSVWIAGGIVVAGLLATSPAQAQAQSALQWKWKDDKGQMHVSDMPPPREVPDKNILSRPTPPSARAAPKRAALAASSAASSISADAAAPKPRVDAELETRKARAEAEQRAKTKAEEDKLAAQRSESCQRARQQMAAIQSGQRIARVNAQGEREILDDAGRNAERQAAQRVIDSDCR